MVLTYTCSSAKSHPKLIPGIQKHNMSRGITSGPPVLRYHDDTPIKTYFYCFIYQPHDIFSIKLFIQQINNPLPQLRS